MWRTPVEERREAKKGRDSLDSYESKGCKGLPLDRELKINTLFFLICRTEIGFPSVRRCSRGGSRRGGTAARGAGAGHAPRRVAPLGRATGFRSMSCPLPATRIPSNSKSYGIPFSSIERNGFACNLIILAAMCHPSSSRYYL